MLLPVQTSEAGAADPINLTETRKRLTELVRAAERGESTVFT